MSRNPTGGMLSIPPDSRLCYAVAIRMKRLVFSLFLVVLTALVFGAVGAGLSMNEHLMGCMDGHCLSDEACAVHCLLATESQQKEIAQPLVLFVAAVLAVATVALFGHPTSFVLNELAPVFGRNPWSILTIVKRE